MDHDCHEKGRHFLTEDDRKFLYGAKDISKKSESNTRTRIRERLRCAIDDIYVLSDAPKKWNINKMVRGMEPEENNPTYRDAISLISLAYSMAESSDTTVNRFFTDGIWQANQRAKEIDVEIDVEHRRPFDPNTVKEKVERGKLPSPWEIGMLYHTETAHMEVTYGEDTKPIVDLIQEMAQGRDSDYLYSLWKDI